MKGKIMVEDKKEDKRRTWTKYETTVVGVGVALGAAAVGLTAWWLLSGSKMKAEEKMMRAPGRPGVVIPRNYFEKDPSSYFHDLRNNIE